MNISWNNRKIRHCRPQGKEHLFLKDIHWDNFFSDIYLTLTYLLTISHNTVRKSCYFYIKSTTTCDAQMIPGSTER